MLPEENRQGFCRSCRESNKHCDKRKPRCSECVRAENPCGGYDLGRIFINVNSSVSPPSWNRGQSAQKHLLLDLASQPTSSSSQDSRIMAASLPSTSLSLGNMSVHSVDASSVLPALVEPENIRRLVDLFLDTYLRRYGPSKTSIDPLTAGNECGGWRLLLPVWLGHSAVLDTAIEGMAAYFIGTQYEDVNLSNHGRKKYLHALQMVQEALATLDSSGRKYLLATTLVMGSTELFMFNGGGPSQLTHIRGATRLLNLSLDTSNTEEFYVYILNQGLFEAILNRHPYVFSSPPFRHFVHNIYSVSQTNRNNLYFQWCERVLHLPNALSTIDNIMSSSSRTPDSVVLAILDDLTAIEHSIIPWYESLHASGTGPWPLPVTQASTHLIGSPLQFGSIEECTNYCLYWVSQLLILEARQMLCAKSSSAEVSRHRGPDTLYLHMSDYASLVCRSVQYCTQNTSFAATENMFLPLDVVSSYYMRQGDHSRVGWCIEAFTRISHEQKIVYVPERFKQADTEVVQHAHDTVSIWDRI